jgi:hypothetical protein
MENHKITASGYAGYWTASCTCGWVGNAHRSSGALNAEPRAMAEGARHRAEHKAGGR